jgi:hypothetical protein
MLLSPASGLVLKPSIRAGGGVFGGVVTDLCAAAGHGRVSGDAESGIAVSGADGAAATGRK